MMAYVSLLLPSLADGSFRPCKPTARLNTMPDLILFSHFPFNTKVMSRNSRPMAVPTFFVSLDANMAPSTPSALVSDALTAS